MSVIIIPRKHLTQPQGRVTLAPEFIGRVAWAFNPSLPQLDYVGGGFNVSGAAQYVGRSGIYCAATSSPAITTPSSLPDVCSTFFFCEPKQLSGLPILYNASNGAGVEYWIGRDSAAWSIGGFVAKADSAIMGKPQGVFARKAGSQHQLDVSGFTPATTTRVLSAGTGATLLSFGSSGLLSGKDQIETYLAAQFFGWVSDAMVQDLFASPWQLFRADPIRIYSLPSGPISVSWSSLTASGITQTGATMTLGGITR